MSGIGSEPPGEEGRGRDRWRQADVGTCAQLAQLIGSAQCSTAGTLAFYLRGRDEAEPDRRWTWPNVMLNAGLQPVPPEGVMRWRRSTATCAGCRAATNPARIGAGRYRD